MHYFFIFKKYFCAYSLVSGGDVLLGSSVPRPGGELCSAKLNTIEVLTQQYIASVCMCTSASHERWAPAFLDAMY